MKFNLDISKHLTGATGKGLMLHGQALALCMPYIIVKCVKLYLLGQRYKHISRIS